MAKKKTRKFLVLVQKGKDRKIKTVTAEDQDAAEEKVEELGWTVHEVYSEDDELEAMEDLEELEEDEDEDEDENEDEDEDEVEKPKKKKKVKKPKEEDEDEDKDEDEDENKDVKPRTGSLAGKWYGG